MSIYDTMAKAQAKATQAWASQDPLINEMVCGYSWLWFPVDGRSKLAKELKSIGAELSHGSGMIIWSTDFADSQSQSMERKILAVEAAEAVFLGDGYKCYTCARLD